MRARLINYPHTNPPVSLHGGTRIFPREKKHRACATVIPTRVVQGKLWLWPDSSPEGVEESNKVAPVVVPDLDVVREPRRARRLIETRLCAYPVAPCLVGLLETPMEKERDGVRKSRGECSYRYKY